MGLSEEGMWTHESSVLRCCRAGYVPGTMVVNNGDQYHCPANFVDLIPDDLRITVQGHGIFSEGAWRLFA